VDWDDAFQRALQLGRSHERDYENANGARVRRRLHSVATLDLIRSEELDGGRGPLPMNDPSGDLAVPFDFVFTPEDSQPEQSV
jgi:hypothetical protein